MTMIEYLLYIARNKGFLLGEESRLSEVSAEDILQMEKSYFIEIDYEGNKVSSVSLTDKGYDYLVHLD